jgi:SET domain-containing protein
VGRAAALHPHRPATLLSKPAIRVGEGPFGRGVFAARAIAAGETLELCPTLEVGEDDASGLLADYVFGSAQDDHGVVLPLGYGMLYNHSAEPNTEYVEEEPGVIAFLATKPIAAGEECVIDYGPEWWDTRGLEPG